MSPKSGLTEHITEDKLKLSKSIKRNFEKDDSFSWLDKPFGYDQQFTNIAVIGNAHACALYYTYLNATQQVVPVSIIFEIGYAILAGLGTTIGCHRYWTHKTFKAKMPLQILLMMAHSMTIQWPIYKWCLDHRIHHKYTDTDADPHNSKRGFWFSHIGWLFLPKTKELKAKLKTFDMPDLENDPILQFQSRWYLTLVAVFQFLIPLSVYYYVFNMPLLYGYLANCRSYLIGLHVTFCVNSVAHIWGDKPYDKDISSVYNKVIALFAFGEGWHNYHHTFPWDYRASEFPWKLNLSTILIDFFAWIGWAWDMKTVPEHVIHEKMKKAGDISRTVIDGNGSKSFKEKSLNIANSPEDYKLENHVWGWDDQSLPAELRKITQIINPE